MPTIDEIKVWLRDKDWQVRWAWAKYRNFTPTPEQVEVSIPSNRGLHSDLKNAEGSPSSLGKSQSPQIGACIRTGIF